MDTEYLDIRFWPKFAECDIMHEGTTPYFCVNMLYKQTFPADFDYEEGTMDEKEKLVWKGYWYSLS